MQIVVSYLFGSIELGQTRESGHVLVNNLSITITLLLLLIARARLLVAISKRLALKPFTIWLLLRLCQLTRRIQLAVTTQQVRTRRRSLRIGFLLVQVESRLFKIVITRRCFFIVLSCWSSFILLLLLLGVQLITVSHNTRLRIEINRLDLF